MDPMKPIIRDPEIASREKHDLIIIGGGIYGVTLALVAGQMGLKNLLIEKNDFGSATSYNSLRTLHGGLRYLQKLDLPRFFSSISERRWFLKNFPDLVHPLPCLMPLYSDGMYRPSILGGALSANNILSMGINKHMPPGQSLPPGRVIQPKEVVELFSAVDPSGLTGGAVWYDGTMPSSQRILMEILRWAVDTGSNAINYMEVRSLVRHKQAIEGVSAVDHVSGKSYSFSSPVIINTSGPWSRSLATQFDRDYPNLYFPSLAWNALLDKPSLSSHALAIKPKRSGSRMYFLHSWHGKILAGTVHTACSNITGNPTPVKKDIIRFIDDLNLAIPSLNAKVSDIKRFFVGLLPAKRPGTADLSVRPVFVNHGKHGGPEGFFSVSGVKFTTAREIAQKTLEDIYGKGGPDRNYHAERYVRRNSPEDRPLGIFPLNSPFDFDRDTPELRKIIQEESVIHLDDLILRRTNIGDLPEKALQLLPSLATLFSWNSEHLRDEIIRLKRQLSVD
jgi:glycerol-3-phosphate dehydrogenase